MERGHEYVLNHIKYFRWYFYVNSRDVWWFKQTWSIFMTGWSKLYSFNENWTVTTTSIIAIQLAQKKHLPVDTTAACCRYFMFLSIPGMIMVNALKFYSNVHSDMLTVTYCLTVHQGMFEPLSQLNVGRLPRQSKASMSRPGNHHHGHLKQIQHCQWSTK